MKHCSRDTSLRGRKAGDPERLSLSQGRAATPCPPHAPAWPQQLPLKGQGHQQLCQARRAPTAAAPGMGSWPAAPAAPPAASAPVRPQSPPVTPAGYSEGGRREGASRGNSGCLGGAEREGQREGCSAGGKWGRTKSGRSGGQASDTSTRVSHGHAHTQAHSWCSGPSNSGLASSTPSCRDRPGFTACRHAHAHTHTCMLSRRAWRGDRFGSP
jgi:hypothetical protein